MACLVPSFRKSLATDKCQEAANVVISDLQLYNQHTIAEHIELISTLLGDLVIAAHNKILAREGCRKHNMAGPRPVEVSQQHVHHLEVEPRVNVEICPPPLGFYSAFVFFVDDERLKSSHDGCSDGDDAASLCPGPIDLCCSLVSNLEVFGPDFVVLNLLCTDMTNREYLGRSNMQRNISHLNPLTVI